ncbi:WXG100 family type VII secretion target [Amycolatopsis sp. cmx-4-61]|uniref:WXG100 family type VII secretion target n=1 Tax=Amycolatopsis sp. cmx-4-61 TaxID=2790937 RepID=UPI00397DA9E2
MIVTPPPPPGTTDPAALPYPDDADVVIRRAASFVGAHGIITLLDKLRTFIAGDIGKVLHLADTFAGHSALTDAIDRLNTAQLKLSSAWHGDAADQFATYAGMAKPILTQNQASLVTLTKTMSSIAETIIDTYKNLLIVIGKCAININQLGGKIGIAIGTSVVLPPLAPISFKDIADALNTAFATFWQDCLTLLGGMVTDIGKLIGNRIELTTIETTFTALPEVGTSTGVIGDPARWHVKPGASQP